MPQHRLRAGPASLLNPISRLPAWLPVNDGFGGRPMGDYTGNMWGDFKLFIAWPDTRRGTAFVDELGGLQIVAEAGAGECWPSRGKHSARRGHAAGNFLALCRAGSLL